MLVSLYKLGPRPQKPPKKAHFEICSDYIAVSKIKDTLPIFSELNMDSNMVTPCSIRFQAIGRKLAECLYFRHVDNFVADF